MDNMTSAIVGAYNSMGGSVEFSALDLLSELAGIPDEDLERWLHGILVLARERRSR